MLEKIKRDIQNKYEHPKKRENQEKGMHVLYIMDLYRKERERGRMYKKKWVNIKRVLSWVHNIKEV